jgi:FYVE/RhoGEF/PH domain-containing protein 5/6
MNRHRTKVAQEILSTEKSYVESLKNVNQIVIPAFKAVFDDVDPNSIFSNIGMIYELNRKLCDDIEARVVSWTNESSLGDIFLSFSPFLKMYSMYVSNHDHAIENIMMLQRKQNEKYDKFALVFANEPILKGHDLNSFLIMPIQRIPRYKLLLTELLKRTKEDHSDYQNNTKALDYVSAVAMRVNEAIRAQQARMNLIAIQKQFNNDVEIFSPTRHLVRQGNMFKQCRKYDVQYEFFLFNDFLIYASRSAMGKLKLHRKIGIMDGFSIADCPDSDKKNCFLIINPTKSFLVYTNTPEEKQQWMDSFAQVCKENNISSATTTAPVWQSDKDSTHCPLCKEKFTIWFRRHHCRICGGLCCDNCSKHRVAVAGTSGKQRACNSCHKSATKDADKSGDYSGLGSSFLPTEVDVPETPKNEVILDDSDSDSDDDKDKEDDAAEQARRVARMIMSNKPPLPQRKNVNVDLNASETSTNTEPLSPRVTIGYLHYIAHMPNIATNTKDLEFNTDDSIHVYHKDPSGWYLGRNTRTDKTGIFLGVYVKEDLTANAALLPPNWLETGITIANKDVDPSYPTAMAYDQYDYICISTRQDDGWCYGINLSDRKEGWIFVSQYTSIIYSDTDDVYSPPVPPTPTEAQASTPTEASIISPVAPEVPKPVSEPTPAVTRAPAVVKPVEVVPKADSEPAVKPAPRPAAPAAVAPVREAIASPIVPPRPRPVPAPTTTAPTPGGTNAVKPNPNARVVNQPPVSTSSTNNVGLKCTTDGCDCVNFQAHAFKKKQCRECFHGEEMHQA